MATTVCDARYWASNLKCGRVQGIGHLGSAMVQAPICVPLAAFEPGEFIITYMRQEGSFLSIGILE